MTESVVDFRSWLQSEHKLAARTAEVYAAMADFGLRRGRILLPVERARTRGSLKVATAALRLWGEWTSNPQLSRRATAIAGKRKVKATVVTHITDEERTQLVSEGLRRLEEPYYSVMVVIAASGLRLATLLDLSRIQIEVGRTEQVPILGPQEKIGQWSPPPEVREAFAILGQYGGWDRFQDLLGRDYSAAYFQLRSLLRYACRKAGIRHLRPMELTLPENPIRYPKLDEVPRCA